jgi:uncharacterized DUF497 family protein
MLGAILSWPGTGARLDEGARLIDDPDHSEDEERFVLLGYSLHARCLIVVHCYREGGSLVRLISARRATVHEEEEYWSFNEERIRFLEVPKEPVCKTTQASGHDTTRYRFCRLLQGTGGRWECHTKTSSTCFCEIVHWISGAPLSIGGRS